MSKKKPAHVIIVEMVKHEVGHLKLHDNINDAVAALAVADIKKKLAILLKILKEMVIPDKDIVGVVERLRLIRGHCLPKSAEELFPESLFLAIAPPANPEK